jgi:hypothetical protein
MNRNEMNAVIEAAVIVQRARMKPNNVPEIKAAEKLLQATIRSTARAEQSIRRTGW